MTYSAEQAAELAVRYGATVHYGSPGGNDTLILRPCDLASAINAALSQQAAPGVAGDWPEDFSHENGQYQCMCCHCGNMFIGHKRRVTCKACASQPHPTGDTQQEAVAWMYDYEDHLEKKRLVAFSRPPVEIMHDKHKGLFKNIRPIFTHPPEATALAQQVKDFAIKRVILFAEVSGVEGLECVTEDIAAFPIPEPRPDALVAMAYRKAADCCYPVYPDGEPAVPKGYGSGWSDAAKSHRRAIESLTPPDAQAALEELERKAKRWDYASRNFFRCASLDMGGNHTFTGLGRGVGRGNTLDEAIDSAIVRATLNQQKD